MLRTLILPVLLLWSSVALALSPYIYGDRVPGGDLNTVMTTVESKLTRAGFQVVGRYAPQGI
ncbi:MAG: hypothetical protein RMN24_15255, partial [Anaerolineae bacterium]|nr:hypothetical protein [Anaerolineae bacterium]